MSPHRTLCALLVASTAGALTACGTSRPPTVAQTPAPVASAPRLHPPRTANLAYRRAVETDIARRLHTPLADLESQLRSQVRAAPGSTLMTLAKPLGFAQDQLGTIVLASLDDAADAAVRSGRWTPTGARKEKRYWTAQPAPSLITEVTRWFVNG